MKNAMNVKFPSPGLGQKNYLFANTFVGQVEPHQDAFFLTIGQTLPPAPIGTPGERAEQLEQIGYVPVKPILRLAFTRERLECLDAILQTNLDQYKDLRREIEGGDEP
jgi:hypothetical protein